MAKFSELIKNFNKIRDYMRDFYIYGFKSRGDFNAKSLRTYDNEKRRIEGYLGEYMKWEYGTGGKKTVISLDSSRIRQNPLYAAWKSKSFTANDIMLHFYILDNTNTNTNAVTTGEPGLSVSELTDIICRKSEMTFDAQLIRLKCVEYVNEGILVSEKQGKTVRYHLSQLYFEGLSAGFPLLPDVVKFFMETAPFGEIGSFILDNADLENDIFSFKHHYIVHTIEDGILFDILSAIRKNATISFENVSERTKSTACFEGIPLRIFVSAATGRRYLCLYASKRNRFTCFRLDYIKSVKQMELSPVASALRGKLENNLKKVWGVGFGGRNRAELLSMKLFIDEEKEQYIIERIIREGRGGSLVRLDTNTFLYTKECYDTNEMSPWIKTFIGRIIAIEGTNEVIIERFYKDISTMYRIYFGGEAD